MNIEKHIIDYCDDEAIEDVKWFNEVIEEKLSQTKESHIGERHVKIYINDSIGFINFKKHRYHDYNKATLIYGNMERDKMLRRRKTIDINKFVELVNNRISNLVLDKFREKQRRKAIQKENKRKRIPINIDNHIRA